MPIPMSMDNYAYLITDQRSGTSVLVDAADAAVVAVCQPFLILTVAMKRT